MDFQEFFTNVSLGISKPHVKSEFVTIRELNSDWKNTGKHTEAIIVLAKKPLSFN